MAIDEFLFGRISTYFKLKKLDANLANKQIIPLSDISARLGIIAKAITGTSIEIYPAEREGGYKNNVFFLPISCNLFNDTKLNLSFYYYRVLYLATQKKLNINLHTGTEPSDDIVDSKNHSSKILHQLFRDFPLTESTYYDLANALSSITNSTKELDNRYWLYGKLMQNEVGEENKNLLQNVPSEQTRTNSIQPQTIIKSKAVEEIKSITIDKKSQDDYVLTHNFEKVDTADEFSGTWRDFDGEDELEDHKNALDELNLKLTVRVDDPVHSVYQSDFLENTNISESALNSKHSQAHLYNEWDYKKKNYKIDFCKVFPYSLQANDDAFYLKTIRENKILLNGLRKMLTNVNNRLQQQRRQTSGSELDIDSVTDLFIELKSGFSPEEKVYLSNRKKEKEISIMLLLDSSLSSDGYVNGTNVLDIEKEISVLFGEILNEFNIDFNISTFHSNTRNNSSFIQIKAFDDKWSTSKNNIGAIEPTGYTRIGTAIRHASTLLESRESKSKWMLLISDGKPNDYDRYEGKYGIEDTKQALRELNSKNINSYALAIEANAKYYLPQMFGQNHYQILSSTEELVTSLVKLYEHIKELK